MTMEQLKEYLEKTNYDPRTYRIGQAGYDDCVTLEEIYGKWHVYYAERGVRSSDEIFDNEEAACNYIC